MSSVNGYKRLSTALNEQIVSAATKDSDSSGINTAQAAKLQQILTPTVLQQKINSGLDSIQGYYRGNGPQPVIDLTDLAAQAQAAGIKIPEDSGLTKPIKLGTSQRASALSKTFDNVRLGTIIGTLVLVAALLAVSWERHKWAALPDVLIVTGVLVGLVAIAAAAVGQLAVHFLRFGTDAEAFASLGRDLASAIAHDLALRFGIIAGAFLTVGIGTRIWVGRLHPTVNLPRPMAPAPPKAPKRAIAN